MPKERKTKQELIAIIAEQLGVGAAFVTVYRVPQLGWDASLIASPGQASNAATLVKQVATTISTLLKGASAW